MIIENNDKSKKTTLDDSASIYKKRNERETSFKDLQGKEKWQFFCDYILGKILAATAIVGVMIWILWSLFSPKPEVMLHLGVIDSPLTEEASAQITNILTEAFVTDSKTQTINFDTDFYMMTDAYSTRTKLMTLVGAADLDSLIMTDAELIGYSSAGIYEDLAAVVSPELLSSRADKLIYGAELVDAKMASGTVGEIKEATADELSRDLVYAVDVTDFIEKMCGYRPTTRYSLVCLVNGPHTENFEKLFEIITQ